MSEEATAYSFSAHLVPGAGTAGLLRVVSILHTRRADVRQLSAVPEEAGSSVVTGIVTLGNAGPQSLLESLRRCAVVLDVRMEEKLEDAALAGSSPRCSCTRLPLSTSRCRRRATQQV